MTMLYVDAPCTAGTRAGVTYWCGLAGQRRAWSILFLQARQRTEGGTQERLWLRGAL
jgi:hypothetical protein